MYLSVSIARSHESVKLFFSVFSSTVYITQILIVFTIYHNFRFAMIIFAKIT